MDNSGKQNEGKRRTHRAAIDGGNSRFGKGAQDRHDIGGPVAASEFIFPNDVTGKQLSGHAFIKLLARMGRDDVTAHGIRAVSGLGW